MKQETRPAREGIHGLQVAEDVKNYVASARAAGGWPSLVIWHFQMPAD
ncbi:MAG TPA: hypothetical protein VN714_10360 [Trebonia sp.]|nr:hypothetical protein [Trebonia sp.]